MRFGLAIPTDRVDAAEEFLSPDGVSAIAIAAEEAGFESGYVTDHPFPVQRWLDGGGHHALDPFVALSFAAAATTRLRLQTHILVLGYRNPFLLAKSILSLDVLSRGRLIVGVGAGYLRGEFEALGATFDGRGRLAGEALEALKSALSEDDVRFSGDGFEARGNTMRPRPVQRPCPPLWMGGNSRPAIRRAVDHCTGWLPFPNTQAMAKFTRTPALESDEDLVSGLRYAESYAREVGRETRLEVGYSLESMAGAERTMRDYRERSQSLADLGVDWLAIGFPDRNRSAYIDAIRRFGDEVIAKTDGAGAPALTAPTSTEVKQ